jgi:tetratricopeptide (TPR) repeat protein
MAGRPRYVFRRWLRRTVQTHRLYTHVLLVAASTVSGIEAALAHGTGPQYAWIAAAALSAASVTAIEGTARSGAHRRRAAPDKLPELPGTFVGRSGDLRALEEKLEGRREALRKDRSQRNSPVVIYMYGPLGIGKSALAVTFARRIARRYPDGILFANLGEVGAPRDPGEVLGSLLDDLQSPASSLNTQLRADLFQGICADRKILVVLDAAHDASQVAALLPRNPECAVIVTSRRRIGGANSHLVQGPNADEAAAMLYAYAGVPPNTSPESVAEIVELCGRLPLALRSAGEQVARSSSFEELASLLRPEEHRLTRLDHGGHLIKERIRSEYERLSQSDKTALCRLALLSTTTFLPWVLVPLLEADLDEANNTVTRLSEAQLVQIADYDPSGLKRYLLPPLVWCFANTELETDAGRDAAEERLGEYRQNVISEILLQADPALSGLLARRIERSRPADENLDWLQRVSKNTSYWSRSEYGSLVKAIEASSRQGEWELCWRIAAQLGSCVPRYLNPKDYLPCFEQALSAAGRCQDDIGQIRVLLSKAESLVALERYAEASETWKQVQLKCGDPALRQGHAAEVDSLLTACLRNEGEAWLQLGCYGCAQSKFELALGKAAESRNTREQTLISILMAENDTSLRLEHWQDDTAYQDADRSGDGPRFRVSLALSEAARRRGHWADARGALEDAMRPNYGDARRRASVEYRHGRLCLSQWRAERPGLRRTALASAAVGHSATALVRFQAMGNYVGCVRARCLLARALIAAGQLAEAEHQIARAHQDAEQVSPSPPDVPMDIRSACTARIDRAEGELLLAQDRFGDAQKRLEEAARIFEKLSDSWSRAYAMLLLGKACRGSREYIPAMSHLFEARVAFERCGDIVSLTETVREQAMVAREQGVTDYRAEVRRLEKRMKTSTSAQGTTPGRSIRNRKRRRPEN